MTTANTIETLEQPETATSRYAQLAESVDSVDWVGPLRAHALSRFQELGFPTTRMEDWRNTSVAAVAQTEFSLADAGSSHANLPQLSGEAANRLVFVNGFFSRTLSSTADLPEGVICIGMAEALTRHRDLIEPHLGRYADVESHAFSALNMALLQDGVFLYLPDGTVVSDPIHLQFLSTRAEAPAIANIRNLIIAGASAQARIVERYEGGAEASRLTLVVTEVVSGTNSVIELYKLQSEADDAFHFSTLRVDQQRDSRFTASSISFGAALARNDLFIHLGGEGSGCVLDGLYVVGGTQHVDHHTTIDHAQPHCDSVELYKGVLDGRSRGVFDGRIIVRKDAQKTNSAQTNNNLILSESAIIDTKPQLEIYADDVKCTHGSTIGQLDQEAMFYLRSRGISVEDARNLMIYAFASEVVQRIRVKDLREELEATLLEKLPGQDRSGVSP